MSITPLSFRGWLPAVLFAGVVLAINGHWFRVPLVESADLAANSIQVYHAKMLRELLGNYSRWEFHHPGPVFFYLLAAGEYLFRDWLRVVPAPLNAQLVTLVLVNTALLFGAIEIFARQFPGTLFRPLAAVGAVWLIWSVNQAQPGAALVSLWMPHVALFAFLFFCAACASVAAGRAGDLPLLALGAMMLVHLHVAQMMFAGVMSLAACAALAARVRRELRHHVGAIGLSAGIVGLFLVPIVVEILVHKPNNLDYVRAYLERYPNPHQGLVVAARYLLSFLTFSNDADLRVYAPTYGLLAQAAHTPAVVTYWTIFGVGLCAAAAMAANCRKLISRFVWMVLAECAVIAGLFLYWANRITGDMYNFNGFFFYSIHLLGLFLIAGVVSGWQANRRPGVGLLRRAAWVVPFVSMAAVAGEFRSAYAGTPAIVTIADGLRGAETYELLFQHDDWITATGVANQLARRGQAFCVTGNWGFMFGHEYECRAGTTPRKVVITNMSWFDLGRRPLKLPVVIDTEEVAARKEGFYAAEYAREGNHCWSGRTASLIFTLESGAVAAEYGVTVTGSVLPYRPVEVSINGHRLGVADGIWKSSTTFRAGREWLRPGEMNTLTFETANAGPITGDARELGFALMSVRIDGAGQ